MNDIVAPTLPAIGTPCFGGILLGRQFVDAEPYAIIGARKAALAHLPTEVEIFTGRTPHKVIAPSVFDGLANTRAYAEAGSEVSQRTLELTIEGHRDWYIPSRGEYLLALAANLQGEEAFERDWYWSSSQPADAPSCGIVQSFDGGDQYWLPLGFRYRFFAVRRTPIR